MLPCLALAQRTLTLSGPPTARPGDVITLTMNMSAPATPGVVAIQWTNSFTTLSNTAGASATSATKQLTCNNYNGGQICLVYGNNLNTISSGVLATFTYQIPASQPIGPMSLRLVEPASATATLSSGVLSGVTLVNGGQNFPGPVTVQVSKASADAGNITPAAVTANLSNGVVTGFTVVNGGSGYTLPPLIGIMPLGTVASSATGTGLTVTNVYYTVNILSKFDINGDGTINVTDLNLLLDQVQGRTSCTDDYNSNGVCDVQDVVLMQRAIQGLP